MSNALAIPNKQQDYSPVLAASRALAMPITAGSLDAYIHAVSQVPVLTAEEEQALARDYADNNNLVAAQNLIVSNLRFVVHVARSYMGYGLQLADLVQEGNIGLMKAVKRFDADKGVRLVSFAVHWVRAEIHDFVIKNWRIVKVATTKAQRKLFFNLRKAKSRLGWFTADEAAAVADDLGVTVRDVHEMESRLTGRDMSLLGESDDDDEAWKAPIAQLEAPLSSDPALSVDNSEQAEHSHDQLVAALAELDERSRDIIASRWLNEPKQTLHQLADRYSVSAERIRQLEAQAMKKLKVGVAQAA